MATTTAGSKLAHNIKGKSTTIDPSTGKLFPVGVTPDVDFIIYPENKQADGTPIESGFHIKTKGYPITINDLLTATKPDGATINNNIPDAFNAFGDNYDFLHGSDPDIVPTTLDQYNDVYLSTFVETDTDNEDPVMYGFDLIINYDNSPLFNGAIEDFLNQFPNYAELTSRLDTITEFKKQFFKFFKVITTDSVKNYVAPSSTPRTYYIKKISGLNGLSENISPEKSKEFTNYGKDVLTLSFYDDVSVNAGYLAFLYKTLTWSKRSGKEMIPCNLLRFDLEIVVTEVRKYNRIVNNNDVPASLSKYADITSRYNYRVYDCQFFFEEMSHGNEIDMYNIKLSDNLTIKFNYKYSTCRFEKMLDTPSTDTTDGKLIRNSKSINNANLDLGSIDGIDTNNTIIENGKITHLPPLFGMNKYGIGYMADYDVDANIRKQIKDNNSIKYSVLDALKQNADQHTKDLVNNTLSNLKKFLPTNILAGFTPDGWQYNIPVYLENKVFNTLNNNLQKTINTERVALYAAKNLFVEQNLNIDNLIKQPTRRVSIYSTPPPTTTTPSTSPPNPFAQPGKGIYNTPRPTPTPFTRPPNPFTQRGKGIYDT
jgi:hypothetical protein